jgi:hypothetical protein
MSKFEIVYGRLDEGGSGATVGVQRGGTAQSTQFECNTPGSLSQGLKLVFTQPSCLTLIGHVTWQGRPPQPNVRQQMPISLTLTSGTTEIDYPAQTTDSNGYFTVDVSALPAGNYTWRAKGPQFLANSGTISLSGAGMTSVEMGTMRAGDANNDNRVNIGDFAVARATFGLQIGDPGYDGRADFTGDGTVNVADYSLLMQNFGSVGAPPIGP